MLRWVLQDYQRSAATIVFTSFAAISFALISQYGFGLNPCDLCIYQRIPYVFAIAFGLVAYGAARQSKDITKLFLGLSALTFAIGASIAAFHVGVEQGWWEGLTSCSTGDSSNLSLEELRAMVLSAPVVRCDEVAWSLFGVSMAGYNAILSSALSIFSISAIVKSDHKEPSDD